MDKLMVYRVRPHRDSEWCVVVVARDCQEAKRIGWDIFPVREADYIDMRVNLVKGIEVPAYITQPHGWDSCWGQENWLCGAFVFDPENCEGCKRYDEKYAQMRENDE